MPDCRTTHARRLPRAPRPFRRRLAVASAVVATVGSLVASVAPASVASASVAATPVTPAAAAPAERSVGYAAYWDQARAVASVSVAGRALTEVSPSWYTPLTDGSVTVQEAGRVDDSAAAVAAMRAGGAKLVPAIANYRNKRWDRTAVAAVLVDSARRSAHVAR